jgi:hypothetical protein
LELSEKRRGSRACYARLTMHRRHALVEEAVVATVALSLLSTLVAIVFWGTTGLSPWPGVVIGEAVAISWGVILIVLTSPSRRR